MILYRESRGMGKWGQGRDQDFLEHFFIVIFLIKMIGVILVNRSKQVSSVQFNNYYDFWGF